MTIRRTEMLKCNSINVINLYQGANAWNPSAEEDEIFIKSTYQVCYSKKYLEHNRNGYPAYFPDYKAITNSSVNMFNQIFLRDSIRQCWVRII